MSTLRVYIYGQTGRIGSLVSFYLQKKQILCISNPAHADVIVLAVPQQAVESLLKKHHHQRILDMSGFCKRNHIGGYGLHRWEPEYRILQNVGCFASSVIQGLLCAKIKGLDIDGALYVNATGGASTAHKNQEETCRLARRLWSHPHQEEIEKAIPALLISHFAITLQTGIHHGIWTCIMGRFYKPRSSTAPIDGNHVLGRKDVHWALQCKEHKFILTVALDNLHFPAFHACSLIQSLTEG